MNPAQKRFPLDGEASRKQVPTNISLIIGILFVFTQFWAVAAGNLTLTWDLSPGVSVVGYNLYYGVTSGAYTNKISTGITTSAIVSNLVQGVTYYFAATAYDNSGAESPYSNTATCVVPLTALSQMPTLDPISDLFLTPNPGLQMVSLSGIAPGVVTVNKKPKIKITASSSNRALIKNISAKYKNPGTTGTLKFKLLKNAVGTTTVTVTMSVKNGGTVVRKFNVTVLAPETNSAALVANAAVTLPASAAILTPVDDAAGEFALTLAGETDQQYVIQASENMTDWVPVYTNSAPFKFVDTQASQFKQRFYRSVSAP